MINCKLILYVLSLILLLSLAEKAHAYTPQRGNVSTILGPYYSRTNYEGEAADKSYDGGLYWVILGDISDVGSLEITTTFMNKIFYRRNSGYLVAEDAQVVHVSAGYRRWFYPQLSASMSLYTSYPLGNSQRTFNNFPPGIEIASTTAQENSETGLDFGLQGELWSQGRYALVVEGRYSWALTKKNDEFSDQYGAAIAIRYFFQGQDTPREK